MDRSTPIYLVASIYSQNNEGVISEQVTERKVYADVVSVTRSEWFEGARIGLNPELSFRMFAPDYNGEKILKFNDRYYSIYRTYMGRNDILELYCQRRTGVDDPARLIAVSDLGNS